jgi:hypothetical protein
MGYDYDESIFNAVGYLYDQGYCAYDIGVMLNLTKSQVEAMLKRFRREHKK